jgi:uncharacterized protein YbjQ (UPF0145 family)
MIISTSESITGKQITQTLGIVKGNTTRARGIGFDIVASIKMIFGGEISEYSQLMSQAREQAFERLESEAKELGADGVVAVRMSTSMISSGTSEILVYGTAVKFS